MSITNPHPWCDMEFDFNKRLTTGEVAGILMCSQQSVIHLCDNKQIRCYRLLGNHRRISLGDVIEYCREHKVPAVIDGIPYQPEDLPDPDLHGAELCEATGKAVATILQEGYVPIIKMVGDSVVLRYQHHEGEYRYKLNEDQTTEITIGGRTETYVGWWPKCAGL